MSNGKRHGIRNCFRIKKSYHFKKEGIGLNSIKSRVTYLHGDINIDTGGMELPF